MLLDKWRLKMTIPRWKIVFEDKVGVYHCTVRCVRRAFLCGDDGYTGKNFDHRKEWVRSRLVKLAGAFGVDVLGYAVMSNHLHVILRMRPDQVENWHDSVVARRWLEVYTPKHIGADGSEYRIMDGDINLITEDERRLRVLRKRLCSVSWFMKALNEHIARRANREDGCKGRFWESRFGCQRIDSEGALLACLCYVDLNPVRAGITESQEEYEFVSVYDRFMVEKAKKRLEVLRNERKLLKTVKKTPEISEKRQETSANGLKMDEKRLLEDFLSVRIALNRGRFLSGLDGANGVFTHISAKDYYRIVDATGRMLRSDKRGMIGSDVRSLLESLDLDAEEWLDTVKRYRKRFGLVAGTRDVMLTAAKQAQQRWWKGIREVEKVFLKKNRSDLATV